MKIWRYSGTFLILTGILHSIVAIATGKEALLDIMRKGVINGVEEGSSQEFSFWFLALGVFIILLGQTVHHYIKKTHKPAPKFLGYSLLIISLAGGLIVPVSGFWLFLPQGLIIILAKDRRY